MIVKCNTCPAQYNDETVPECPICMNPILRETERKRIYRSKQEPEQSDLEKELRPTIFREWTGEDIENWKREEEEKDIHN